ncbi:MAG: alkaline phosphatase D family protein [Cytophagales bacterium]|nr:alkaline phosphatase D family protein [Cytophagales bacterium]
MKFFTVLLLLLLPCLAPPALADQVLIPAGATWKYLANGSNPGTGWRAASFYDGAWPGGRAQLGYGDGDEATVLSGGPATNRYVTTYFRKSINLPDAAVFTGYALRVKRDDGVVVYVNGTEVWRNNLPAGPIAYNTYASAAAGDDGAIFHTISLGREACKTGPNVVAVEIHQANATSSDVSFDLQLTGLTKATTEVGVNEVVYQWSGALRPTAATVVAKLSRASTSCRLVVSTSSTLSAPLLSAAATASSSNHYLAKMTIAGLQPNTTYYYAVQSDGLTDNSPEDAGRFRTPAAGAFSFKFTVGSCAVNSNHAVYALMKNKAPLFHLATGDFHYANPNSGTDLHVHRLPYERNMLSQPPSRDFFRRVPVAYVWDDHDYCGNNSHAASAGRANARRAYQEYVPHYPLTAGSGDVPIYQAFTVGRIRFILSDLRSERTSTHMMSSAQKTWFKHQCLDARDKRLIIAWVTVVSFGGNQADNWGGYRAERTELSNFFRDNNIRNLFILSGDAHMVAIDNGTNHDFSTGANNPHNYPVFQAAAVNNGGSTKGGTYSEGGTFPNPNGSTGQYGVVEVTDGGGSTITVRFTGYRTAGNTARESVLTTYTFTRILSTAAASTHLSARTAGPGGAVQLAWEPASAPGEYTVEHSPDGNRYEGIGTVQGAVGQFSHPAPATGWNHYRLRGADEVRAQKLFVRGDVRLRLAPNPAQHRVTVHLEHVKGVTAGRYILYNGRMKTERQGDLALREGDNQFGLDVRELAAGEYFLHVVLHGEEIVQKLLVVQ